MFSPVELALSDPVTGEDFVNGEAESGGGVMAAA